MTGVIKIRRTTPQRKQDSWFIGGIATILVGLAAVVIEENPLPKERLLDRIDPHAVIDLQSEEVQKLAEQYLSELQATHPYANHFLAYTDVDKDGELESVLMLESQLPNPNAIVPDLTPYAIIERRDGKLRISSIEF